MRVLGLFLFLILSSQQSFGVQCVSLLTSPKTSHDPTNVAFYMERSSEEVFWDLKLNNWDRGGFILNEKLISIEGFPHFVVVSDTDGQLVILLPKGLRVSATVKDKEMSFVGHSSIVLNDFKFLPSSFEPFVWTGKKVKVKVDPAFIEGQALMQLTNSSTFQREKGSHNPEFILVQNKAFEYFLTKLDQKLRVEDLSYINSLITKDSVLRRGDLYTPDIALIRGKDSRVELHQENTGIHYMSSKAVPRALEDLLEGVNRLSFKSTLLEVAELYQNFIFIHPFPDGNGRTSRALLDYMLIRSGFPTVEHKQETSHIMHYSPAALSQILFRNLNTHL